MVLKVKNYIIKAKADPALCVNTLSPLQNVPMTWQLGLAEINRNELSNAPEIPHNAEESATVKFCVAY